jgi:hypothetical protein
VRNRLIRNEGPSDLERQLALLLKNFRREILLGDFRALSTPSFSCDPQRRGFVC